MCKNYFLFSLILVLVGSLAGSAHAGTVTATYQTAVVNTDWLSDPQDITALSEDGDWRLWDNTLGAPAYEKDTPNELIGDLEQVLSFSLYNSGNDQNFAWSDGVNPASSNSTAAGIGSQNNGEGLPLGGGYQVDVTLPGGSGDITVWGGTRSSVGRLIILDGTDEVFSIDGDDRSNVWGLDRFDLHLTGFTPGTVLTIQWILAPDNTDTSARMQFYGVAVVAGAPPTGASNPEPVNNDEDVQRDPVLSWTPGMFAVTHNVFIGTDFDDVNEATIGEPLSTIAVEGHDVNNFNPGRLEFGQTYYWRIDEVNSPTKPGQFRGNIWQFTIEPIARKLETDNITVTASSTYSGYDVNNLINEAGLDPNTDQHSNNSGMWVSGNSEPNQIWVRFDFDKLYKMYNMLVWNFNQNLINSYGFKQVRIEYSADGQTWTVIPDVNQFAKGPGRSTYGDPDVVPFNGAVASSVRITALSNYSSTSKRYGLSEVRFNYIPVRARKPSPDTDTADAALNTELSWRAGRDADKHYLYLSTDVNSVEQNLVAPIILDDASYMPDLTLGRTYYWKIDEVNNNEEHPVWDGPMWNLSTIASVVIDNFEVGYNDTDANAVWATWIDGYGDNSNGSQMGFDYPGPYLSTTNHSGGHSAPLIFNNTGAAAKSEVTAQSLDLPIGTTNWSIGSPTTLTIWFRGEPNNIVTGNQLYCIIGGKTATYGGSIDDLTRSIWYQWDINLATLGANLSNIPQITIGIKKAGATDGSGTIYLDDIQLTGEAPLIPYTIYREAEDADIFIPGVGPGMTVQTSVAGYSGTGYIASDPSITESQTTLPATGEPNGIASYDVQIDQTGQFRIAFRTLVFPLEAGGTPNNSFWVKISGPNVVPSSDLSSSQEWANFNEIPTTSTWTWVDVWDRTGGIHTITYTINEPGTYTLEVAYREYGTRLDAFEIRKIADLP